MNYPRIYERLYCSVLAVTNQRFQALHAAVLPRLLGKVDTSMESLAVEAMDSAGGGGIRPQRSTVSSRGKRMQSCYPDSNGLLYSEAKPGVAVVPLYGIIAKNLSSFEEDCGGGNDLNSIVAAFNQARHSPAVDAIVIDAGDTPGGEVSGVPEFAADILATTREKPVYGWTDKGCFSAGYWILSGCTEVYATPSAMLGSIGAYCAWLDQTIALQMAGLELHSFEGGKHKASGAPFRGMDDDEKEKMQATVNHFWAMFKKDVRAGRGAVAESTMQGQIFTAEESLDLNLIDGIFSSWDQFIDNI